MFVTSAAADVVFRSRWVYTAHISKYVRYLQLEEADAMWCEVTEFSSQTAQQLLEEETRATNGDAWRDENIKKDKMERNTTIRPGPNYRIDRQTDDETDNQDDMKLNY
jgi:hypothetical protein